MTVKPYTVTFSTGGQTREMSVRAFDPMEALMQASVRIAAEKVDNAQLVDVCPDEVAFAKDEAVRREAWATNLDKLAKQFTRALGDQMKMQKK